MARLLTIVNSKEKSTAHVFHESLSTVLHFECVTEVTSFHERFVAYDLPKADLFICTVLLRIA